MIAQRYNGSVIKQSVGEDDDSDDGMDDPNEVYAVSTVLNLSEKNRYAHQEIPQFLRNCSPGIMAVFIAAPCFDPRARN